MTSPRNDVLPVNIMKLFLSLQLLLFEGEYLCNGNNYRFTNQAFKESVFCWKDYGSSISTESLEITPVVAQSKKLAYSCHIISLNSVSHSNTPCWF